MITKKIPVAWKFPNHPPPPLTPSHNFSNGPSQKKQQVW